MRHHARKTGTWLLACALLVGMTGCARVVPVGTNNAPAGAAETTGVGAAQRGHFDELYPQRGWPPATGRATLTVGPVLVSREALTLLAGDDASTVIARARDANERVMVSAETRSGQTRYFVADTYSYEAQAALVEELVKDGRAAVSVLDGRTVGELQDGQPLVERLRRMGVVNYLEGNLGPAEEGLQLHLRVIATADGSIIGAASGRGRSVDEAVRSAARSLATAQVPR